MANAPRPFPAVPRPVALLLMVAGAAGFVAALIYFSDQILCLFGSTLLVFVGLAMVIAGRLSRHEEWEEAGDEAPAWPPAERSRPAREKDEFAPSSQTAPDLAGQRERQPQEPAGMEGPAPTLPASGREDVGRLAQQVIAIFRGQGGKVSVEARRPDRCILSILSPREETFVAIVEEGSAPVDVAEVRALYALMKSRGGSSGYLIAGGPFTPRAVEWAQERGIQLTGQHQLEDLVL